MIWESKDSELTVQVWEKEGRRELRFGNKIMQSVFSLVYPDYLVLPYTRFMLLGLIFCPEPKTVLHIGLGGGSIARWLHREFPNIKQIIIEVNPLVIEVAHKFFEFPKDERLQVINGDASIIVPNLSKKFDLIFLDAFCENGIPKEVMGVQFLRNLCDCLNSNGWILGNLWTINKDFKEQCEQWESTFNLVLSARANKKGNVIYFGSQIPRIQDTKKISQNAEILEKRHRIDIFNWP